MPGYKGHLVGGAIAFACIMVGMRYWHAPSLFLAVHYFFFSLLGSLFPDIDTKSRGQGIFYRVLLVVLGILLFRGNIKLCLLLSVLAITPLLVRHRGLFHKPWFIVVVSLAVAYLVAQTAGPFAITYYWYAFFFIGGALSHLLLDRIF